MRSLIFAIFSVFFAGSALATEALQVDLSTSSIGQQQQLILKAINNDSKYSEMTPADRASVEAALAEISETLEGGKNIASLDAQSKQKVDLHQEEVNRLLSKAFRDSRLVCTKEAAIGTNMLKRLCKTAAARARDNDISRANGVKVNQ
ncbi:MAG: hypothetical protein ACREPB_08530 [Arenimonas sp.]